MGRVAQPVSLLDVVRVEEDVLDDQEPSRDARHLLGGGREIREVVRRDPAGDDVEALVREGQVVRRSEDVGAHPGRRVDGHDLAALLAQPACDVAAPRRDVERLDALAGLAPLDEEVEVRARAVRLARPERFGAGRPDVAHAASASSTARRAPSSIVASG